MAEVCEHVPAHAPRTFLEALQYYWFVHLEWSRIKSLDSFEIRDAGSTPVSLYHVILKTEL
jgi:formate C-acetyltransferase